MKKLYLDCGMGAAGDMLASALYELLDEGEKKNFLDAMRAIASEGVSVSMEPRSKCGILAKTITIITITMRIIMIITTIMIMNTVMIMLTTAWQISRQ